MLQEARARMVDVETGAEPRPIRTSADYSPPPPADAASRKSDGRAVKRPNPKPDRIAASRVRLQPKSSIPDGTTHHSDTAPADVAKAEVSDAKLGDGGLLWLEDQRGHTSAEPGDGSNETTSWRRGLRG
jgi:hypothetical protein